jgi:hypothetical protein
LETAVAVRPIPSKKSVKRDSLLPGAEKSRSAINKKIVPIPTILPAWTVKNRKFDESNSM